MNTTVHPAEAINPQAAVSELKSAGAANELSDRYAAYVKGWDAALRRAAFICQSVNSHDNPMTANDCADEILALIKTQEAA